MLHSGDGNVHSDIPEHGHKRVKGKKWLRTENGSMLKILVDFLEAVEVKM